MGSFRELPPGIKVCAWLVVDLQENRETMLSSSGDGDVRIPDEGTHSLP